MWTGHSFLVAFLGGLRAEKGEEKKGEKEVKTGRKMCRLDSAPCRRPCLSHGSSTASSAGGPSWLLSEQPFFPLASQDREKGKQKPDACLVLMRARGSQVTPSPLIIPVCLCPTSTSDVSFPSAAATADATAATAATSRPTLGSQAGHSLQSIWACSGADQCPKSLLCHW